MQEGLGIYTVEIYLKVRLAVSEGMTQRQAAKHFNISRDSVAKMLSYSTPPGYQRRSSIQRPKLDASTSSPATKPADHPCKPSQGSCPVHKAERA